MKRNKSQNHPTTKRIAPKQGFSKIFHGKVGRYCSRISEFEDDTPSSTVVRWLLVILLLHLVVIGGVWLRGELKKSSATETASVPAHISSAGSTTATPQVVADDQVIITAKEQLVAAPVVQAPKPPSVPSLGSGLANESAPEAGPARHIVATGDTWESIARDNSCTVLGLKTLNPAANLVSGTTLVIPMKAEERIVIAKQKKAEAVRIAGETYVIKSGDTLSKIARKNKISVAKLQQYNNITDPRKIKIGQAIRIPSK
ncbi:MAG: LysM peptidoglycan-binding domain-containing protein [Akkermansia sp.]